jgi:hypothetical protein
MKNLKMCPPVVKIELEWWWWCGWEQWKSGHKSYFRSNNVTRCVVILHSVTSTNVCRTSTNVKWRLDFGWSLKWHATISEAMMFTSDQIALASTKVHENVTYRKVIIFFTVQSPTFLFYCRWKRICIRMQGKIYL